MPRLTDDLRIDKIRPLIPPAILMEFLPIGERASEVVASSREALTRCLAGQDDRLAVIVGPCSIHDVASARDYGKRLHALSEELSDALVTVMRVYFEKPRTTLGWKGLINDPRVDGTFAVNEGLQLARGLLLFLGELGMPAGCEFLDTITPQYLADLVSWGSVGARTTESQVHRELASGLSMPVGFKNGTDGNVQIAADAIKAASRPHHFLSVTKQGVSAIVATRGNADCHIILRGSSRGPNYSGEPYERALATLDRAGLPRRLMIDCSHGNSGKDPARQPQVAAEIADRIRSGDRTVFGVMLESYLVGGRQDLAQGQARVYGQSLTDPCLGWEETVPVLRSLAEAVRARRRLRPKRSGEAPRRGRVKRRTRAG